MVDECPKCPPAGSPLWLATFADLMSLLMCFFVLLLSFATMDATKFKKMSESLEHAFGVQREIFATEIPMGTSIIAQHFSPAQTEPTQLEEIK
jgi:chemotaxis protein MotB